MIKRPWVLLIIPILMPSGPVLLSVVATPNAPERFPSILFDRFPCDCEETFW